MNRPNISHILPLVIFTRCSLICQASEDSAAKMPQKIVLRVIDLLHLVSGFRLDKKLSKLLVLLLVM